MASIGMTRGEAWELLCAHLETGNLRKHCLATEAVMRRLAQHLGEDPELWGTTGLLHDLDLDLVGGKEGMAEHARRTAEILRARGGVDETAIEAIVRHNETLGLPRETRLQHALAAAETVTGLVTAAVLVLPEKDLASLKPKSVVKRMKEKGFAASVNREVVLECETIGIPLAELAQMAVEAMRSIAPALGLDGSMARKEPLVG